MPMVINSSLTYEILMYLNSFYFGMFAVCELGMTIFKVAKFETPGIGQKFQDIILLFFLLGNEGFRIHFGRKGNFTERGSLIFLSIVLTVFSALPTVYFLHWQDKVLRLELILCSIQLVLLATELIIAIMCLIKLYRPPPPEE